MALVGVSVTKRTAFRDATQEFANVYHYQWPGLDPGVSLAESLLDRIVTIEKTFHASSVTFVHGRVWNAGGSQAENDMILEKQLTGVGATTALSTMDKERAFLFRWRAGNDSRGRPVYLRKFFHTCGFMGVTVSNSGDLLANLIGFTAAERTALEAKVADLHPISFNAGSTIGQLVSPNGRNVTGALEAHKYLEHHQLGDQWRG